MPQTDTPSVAVLVTEHAVIRAAERYGLDPSDEEWGSAMSDIVNGRSLLTAVAEGRERHVVTLCGTPVRAVWEPVSCTLVTLLPWRPTGQPGAPSSRGVAADERRARDRLRREIESALSGFGEAA